MIRLLRRNTAPTVTPRARRRADADPSIDIPPKQQAKRAANKVAAAEASTRPRAVKFQADGLSDFVRKNPLPADIAGIPDKAVVLKAIKKAAKDFEGRTITVDQFVGRVWERLLLRAPNVHRRLADPLNDAVRMQLFFLSYVHSTTMNIDPKTGRPHGGTGFFDAAGDNVYLTPAGQARLTDITRKLGKFASAEPASLARKRLVYADQFRIAGKDFVDGAILMPFAGKYVVLLRIEAKTKFSGGVSSQLGAFFDRLASARLDKEIECYIDGEYTKLDRKQLLFNPTWTDAGVGIQEWDQDLDLWKDPRSLPGVGFADGSIVPAKPQAMELGERLGSAERRVQRLPSDQRSAFLEGAPDASNGERLASLAVSGPVLLAKADMRAMRSWLLGAVEAAKR